MKVIVIGIQDNPDVWFPPQVSRTIAAAHWFSGGRRHHQLVRHLLPHDHQWVDITVPIDDVFARYRQLPLGPDDTLVCFASGDPLFYGFGSTVLRMMPDAQVSIIPAPSSLQTLAHRMLLPYEQMHMVSQTGRPWEPLDQALIHGYRLIGVLADRHRTPSHIAQHLLEYGYTGYRMTVGECLGHPQHERVRTFALTEVPDEADFNHPCCLVLEAHETRPHPLGIPDSDFHLLDGRTRMITKAPIRLATLSTLGLGHRHCLWDIGFCTGSISIEARLQFPHLAIEAFEVRPQCRDIIQRNMQRHGAPGIRVHIGDFMQYDLSAVQRPDAVFIGGHGGRLGDMVQRVRQYMLPGGILVFNSVSPQSLQAMRQAVGPCREMRIALDDHHPITIMSVSL